MKPPEISPAGSFLTLRVLSENSEPHKMPSHSKPPLDTLPELQHFGGADFRRTPLILLSHSSLLRLAEVFPPTVGCFACS